MKRIPLALLPGTLCTGALWREQIESLCDIADIHVIDTAQHDNLRALARHVHSVMPIPFAVARLSYGGIVALSVWRHNPGAISHLALMDTTPLPITPEKQAAQEAQVALASAGAFHEIVSQQANTLRSLAGREQNESYYAKIVAMAEAVGIDGFANQIKAQIQRPDSRPILDQIKCPTLLLCGDRDELCPPDLHREMAEAIPHGWLHIVPECGHLSSMEQPEVVSDAMRKWLADSFSWLNTIRPVT